MSNNDAQGVASGRSRRRAKQACKTCNARRVRCNVTIRRPCDNCVLAQCECDLIESRRGKYGRMNRSPFAVNNVSSYPRKETESTTLGGCTRSVETSSSSEILYAGHPDPMPVVSDISRNASEQRNEDESAVYLGESTSLRCVHDTLNSAHFTHHVTHSNTRLRYPIPNAIKGRNLAPASEIARKAARIETLRAEGAFDFPHHVICEVLLKAYFQWFHPCFPVIDKDDFITSYHSETISPLLLQAVLFIGVIYCDEETLREKGLGERHDARYLFYNRAKDIYDADHETQKVKVLQALFLMSFWRAGPLLEKDTRHWLGTAISLAQTKGMHRSSRKMSLNQSKIGKRIWWSLYVRDRQCAAALGLPNRIRDEDCDLEDLEISDLEEGPPTSDMFGQQTTEHIYYAIEMAKLSKLLGKLVLTEFLPETAQNVDKFKLREELAKWESRLPPEMSAEGRMGNCPGFFANMLHMNYNNLYVLLYRTAFSKIKGTTVDEGGQIAFQAACRNTRIIEDLLSQGLVHHGQVHLITSLFNSLCIHTMDIRRSDKTARQVAEYRAKLCLLGLQELQKTWEVTNWVLQLFFQFLDQSIARRLAVGEEYNGNNNTPSLEAGPNVTGTSYLASQDNELTASTRVPISGTKMGGNMAGGNQRAASHQNHDPTTLQPFHAMDPQDFYFYHLQPQSGYENGMGADLCDFYGSSLTSLNGLSPSDLDYLAGCL